MFKTDSIIANEMLYDLSLFLRCNMEAIINKENIELSEELKFVNAYTNLESIMNTNLVVQNKIKNQSGKILICNLMNCIRDLIRDVVNKTTLLCYITIENESTNKSKITIKNDILEEESYIPITGSVY